MDLFVLIFLLLLGLVVLAMAVRIVPEYRRLVVFRLGRCVGSKGPGIIFLIPFLDRGVSVDLREVYFDVPPQTCITADNASLSIDFLVYDKVIDPERSVLEVEDFTEEGFSFCSAGRIRVSTLHSSKGLDFPVVLLYLPYLHRRRQSPARSAPTLDWRSAATWSTALMGRIPRPMRSRSFSQRTSSSAMSGL